MRFDELAERWISDMKGTVSCNTYRYRYQNAVYNHLMPCFKDKEIDAIRLADMQHFFTEMGKRYKRDTLNKVRMIARKMFEYAIDNEYISGRNPVTNVVLPADDNDSYEVESFTDEQLGYIVDFAHDHRFGAEILFIAETGVRKSEMLGARWSDYSSEGRYIKILRSVAEVKKCHLFCNTRKTNSLLKLLKYISDSGFYFDKDSHRAMYIEYLNVCTFVSDGVHSLSIAHHLKQGKITAKLVDITTIFPYVDTDGDYWYVNGDTYNEYLAEDYRFCLIYEIAKFKYGLEHE